VTAQVAWTPLRLGQDDGLAAEPDAHLGVCGLDVAEGEAADCRGSLSIEEDDKPGEAVFGLEAGLSAAGLPPSCGVVLGFPAGQGFG
jgi:hypothetical protein